MLSQEEIKKLKEEFDAADDSKTLGELHLKRKKVIEKFAAGYVKYDGREAAEQIDFNCPWEILFTLMSVFDIPVYLRFKITPELFSHIRYIYDEMRRAEKEGFFECCGRYDKAKDVILFQTCLEQNYGDEDGFGVEPDVYAEAVMDRNGKFIVPFYVRNE